ncbi:MAG: restriction endonuclease subunit S [Anaerovoracaceae bacterium]
MGNKADNGKTECNKIKHGEAKDEKKVPKLRFPGFSGEWKERKLGEVAERYDNLRVPVSANLRIPGNTPYYGANGIQDYVEGFTHDGEFVLVAEDGATRFEKLSCKMCKRAYLG